MQSPLLLLIALQDIDMMIQEAKDPEQSGAHADLGFKMMKNLDALVTSRGHLAEQLDQRTLGLYERMKKRYGRAVVPVIHATTTLGALLDVPFEGRRILFLETPGQPPLRADGPPPASALTRSSVTKTLAISRTS